MLLNSGGRDLPVYLRTLLSSLLNNLGTACPASSSSSSSSSFPPQQEGGEGEKAIACQGSNARTQWVASCPSLAEGRGMRTQALLDHGEPAHGLLIGGGLLAANLV